MKIPLATFEQVIDKTILKRGFAYFNNGAVSDFTEISKDEYEAIVSGTEDYTVQLNIKNNTIVSYNCDCPYDLGRFVNIWLLLFFIYNKIFWVLIGSHFLNQEQSEQNLLQVK